MKNSSLVSFGVAAIASYGLAASTQSKDSGVWTNADWFDESEGLGVRNGIPYGLDPET